MSLKVLCTECDHPLHKTGRCWHCMTTYTSPQCFEELKRLRAKDDADCQRELTFINDSYTHYGGKKNG